MALPKGVKVNLSEFWSHNSKRKGTNCNTMFTRKIAAYIAALVAIVRVAKIVLANRDRRIAALETRMDGVEADVNATVEVERMRTVLPFPGDQQSVSRGGLEWTRQG